MSLCQKDVIVYRVPSCSLSVDIDKSGGKMRQIFSHIHPFSLVLMANPVQHSYPCEISTDNVAKALRFKVHEGITFVVSLFVLFSFVFFLRDETAF